MEVGQLEKRLVDMDNPLHKGLVSQGLKLRYVVDSAENTFKNKILAFKERPEAKDLDIGEIRKKVIQSHFRKFGFTKIKVIQYNFMLNSEYAIYVPHFEY